MRVYARMRAYMRACACVQDRISSFQADTVRERGAASYIIIAARCTVDTGTRKTLALWKPWVAR